MSSQRTKAALEAAKARGTVLGGRRVSAKACVGIAAEGRKAGTAIRSQKADEWAHDVLPVIEDIQLADPVSLKAIAEGLNERGIVTRRGGEWTPMQVSRAMSRTA
ncbi:recombinase family protein [Granulicella mallensis]|uniref:DNA invertase Pin-like site-specific DNA recombinase n=1 Tax=Granulicella mallensis TaxID=940614 RepID=A0A7W7ZS47_9BACT|nr:recombinase family protein [Granulicella mallensis]MBB5064754.1 DNA invertase Pin-like site-specific DNA recombinase [Granulicella mallensis]